MPKIGIEFTHYTWPSRRKVMRWIHRPMEVEAKAEAVQVAGGRFEVEDVSTTRVRIACVHDSKAIAYKQVRVVDRFITEAVDAIVEKAYEILVQRQ